MNLEKTLKMIPKLNRKLRNMLILLKNKREATCLKNITKHNNLFKTINMKSFQFFMIKTLNQYINRVFFIIFN